jgi:tetratricopeptide (TPR) repeat protein
VRASFDLACRGLDAAARRALAVLGGLGLPDFGAWLAAVALGGSLREAEDVLDQLVAAGLLSAAPGRALDAPRFRFHQLVRLYLHELAATGPPPGIAAAVERSYQAALAAAAVMDQKLHSYTPPVTSDRPSPPSGVLPGPADPAAWFTHEHAALIAAVQGAAARGWTALTWDLALTLHRYLGSHHHFKDWYDVATAGLAAARASGHRIAEAAMLCSLGDLHAVQDDYDSAGQAFTAALTLGTQAGEPGQRVRAWALLGSTRIHQARGQLEEEAAAARRVIEIADAELDRGMIAEAWMSLGVTQLKQGELAAASASFERALAGFTATGDQMFQAILLVHKGNTNATAGRPEEAERCFWQSVRICQQIGFHNGEGFAYTGLGRMQRSQGDYQRAEQSLLAALEIVREYADTFTESIILTNLGALYRASDLRRSREHLSRAVSLLSDGQLPGKLADALAGLAETEVSAGDRAAARTAWTHAISLLAPTDPKRADDLRRRLAALETG